MRPPYIYLETGLRGFQIGKDMLAGEWEAAAKKVLFPRDNDSPAVREALTDLRDGKIGPKECLRRVKGRK